MLIHLDASAVAGATSGGAGADRSHASIENLLLAHFEGDHVVSLLPDHAGLLRGAAAGWSRRARRALDHADESYAQIAGLRREIPWSIELGIGPGFDGTVREVAGGRSVIRASLYAFERVQAAARAALLGENATDADLFVQLGLMMRAARRWAGIALVHEPRGGGGDTTAAAFDGMAGAGRILLAVGDTDMRHPGSGAGGTFRKLEAAARDRPAYQRARRLPARTAEGIVPLAVYRDVLTSPERRGSVDRIEQLLRSAPADVLQYAHLKDGLRRYQVEYAESEAEGAYWSEIARSAGARSVRPAHPRSVHHAQGECGCYVVDALGAARRSPTWWPG